MSRKTCIITGSNSGIGKAAAVQIAARGQRVIMACRSLERGEAALKQIMTESGSGDVELIQVDLSLQSSIRDFAANFLGKSSVLDVLIHNAAAFDIRQKTIEWTAEGLENIWATNHVGPVLLTDLLLEALKRSEQGRIITISSKGLVAYPWLKVDLTDPEFRNRRFSVQKAYYQSKLAQVMYTYWLADNLKDTAVTANAIRVTNVRIDVDSRYPGVPKLMRKMYALKSSFAISPEEMAETYTYLVTSPEVAGITGAYFDDPQHMVSSSPYSKDPHQIEALMNLTHSFIHPLDQAR